MCLHLAKNFALAPPRPHLALLATTTTANTRKAMTLIASVALMTLGFYGAFAASQDLARHLKVDAQAAFWPGLAGAAIALALINNAGVSSLSKASFDM